MLVLFNRGIAITHSYRGHCGFMTILIIVLRYAKIYQYCIAFPVMLDVTLFCALSAIVCGTLFGARSGRIHDIVTDWIASIKGWKPRSLRGPDGRRLVVWESAGDEAVAELEQGCDADPAALLDVSPLRQKVVATLEKVSRKIKVEKSKVAFLCYVTAQDIPITETAVLEELGTGKSRAYALREKAMDLLRKEMRNEKEADSPLFGRVLLETVESELPERLLAKIGGVA